MFMGYVRYAEEYNIKMDLKRHIFRNARVGLGASSMADTCSNDNKHSGSKEDGEFFTD